MQIKPKIPMFYKTLGFLKSFDYFLKLIILKVFSS